MERKKYGYEHQPPLPEWKTYADHEGRIRGNRIDRRNRESFAQDIDIAAEGAAALVREAYDITSDSVRRQNGLCYPTSITLSRILDDIGTENTIISAAHRSMGHTFLRVIAPDGTPFLVDPTWQQFLPQSANYDRHPDTL